MTTHTPGPWVTTGRWIQREGSSGAVAETTDGPGSHANARLIAAAPDMLEALQSVIAEVRRCERCNGSGNDPPDPTSACSFCGGYGEDVGGDIMEAVYAARAAIARATGGEG